MACWLQPTRLAIGRRGTAAGHSIAGRHALPRARSHEALTENSLRTEARAGPITPRGEFRSVSARAVRDAVAEKLFGRAWRSWLRMARAACHRLDRRYRRAGR